MNFSLGGDEEMVKKYLFALLTSSAAILLSGGTASAEDLEYTNVDSLIQRVEFLESRVAYNEASDCGCTIGSDCCDGGCGSRCASGCGHFTVLAEVLFLRFFSADGVDDNTGGGTERFDFYAAPRVTVGYKSAKGLSTRLRYFSYDHTAPNIQDEPYLVKTFNVDFEIAQELKINRLTLLEINAGGRYNHYKHKEDETFDDFGIIDQEFDGVGLTFGAEIKRELGCGALYGRARHAVLLGDGRDPDDGEFIGDQVLGQLELGIGYELVRQLSSGCVLSLRTGIEVQQWSGYEDEQVDVGFGGFLSSVGINY
jgi:hypothetical protein